MSKEHIEAAEHGPYIQSELNPNRLNCPNGPIYFETPGDVKLAALIANETWCWKVRPFLPTEPSSLCPHPEAPCKECCSCKKSETPNAEKCPWCKGTGYNYQDEASKDFGDNGERI